MVIVPMPMPGPHCQGYERQRISRNIESFGVSLVGVFDAPIPFVYTIGHAGLGLPELLVVLDIPLSLTARVVNMASLALRSRGRAFDHCSLADIGGPMPVKAVNAIPPVRDEFTCQAGSHWNNETYQVQQLLLCDRHGRFPGDPACEKPFCGQPWLAMAG